MTTPHGQRRDQKVAWIVSAVCLAIGSGIVWWGVSLGRSEVASLLPGADLKDLSVAYDKVMTRIEHFEDMLVTIGTVSLAILAGIGGVVFTQDSRLFPEASARGAATTLTESQRQAHCDKVYAGIVTLTVLTSVAYTHVFRYYCNCYSYACELEIRLFSDARSRLNSSIWADMSIGAPAWLTYSFIGLYSVAVSIATVILFGRHFHQSKTRQSAIAWTLLLLALAYVTPSISRYMATVRLAQGH